MMINTDGKEENKLQETRKSLRIKIGKLHAEACSHRLNKDVASMREAHRLIERCEAEIKECEYLLEWVHVTST
jgi:hypothetical protein